MTADSTNQTLADLGEFALIDALTRDLAQGEAVRLGPGDDAAVLDLRGPVVVSTDVLVEGVHFRRDWSTAEEVGRKSVAVNVADIEAMGADPLAVLVAFSAPADLPVRWALELAQGIKAECSRAAVSLVGGDVTRSQAVTVAVTAVGTLGAAEPVTRSGARPGDVMAMVGRTGWAAGGLVVLGRGFRSPRVLVEAAKVPEVPYGEGAAANRAGATAMIDISDGLLADVGHIATSSQVVVDLTLAAFDVAEPLQAVAAATGTDAYSLILTGGEDHALVATFADRNQVPSGWRVIGSVRTAREDEEATVLVDGVPFEGDQGFDHFRKTRR